MADTEYKINLILEAQNKASTEIQKVSGQITGMQDALARIGISAIAISAVKKASSAVSSAVSKVSSLLSGERAKGGPVYAGKTYLVGERGPELFTAPSNGKIIPNNEITNNNGVTININGVSVRNDSDIESITNEIIRKIKLERQFGIA